MPATIPAEGDRVTVERLPGYRLVQERPFACRPACTCGTCDGTPTKYPGTVERVVYYADNSIEATVVCDDGERRTLYLVAPHGDAC